MPLFGLLLVRPRVHQNDFDCVRFFTRLATKNANRDEACRMTSYILAHLSVLFSAATAAWTARGKSVDLFGVLVLGLVTATGGGTLRDVLLDVPVFWIADSSFLVTGAVGSFAAFFVARYTRPPERMLQIPDAIGLAFVTMLGTAKAFSLGHAGPVCLVMGVMSGVAGGMLRDVLSGEIPLVFRSHIYLYATAAACGSVVFLILGTFRPGQPENLICGAIVILMLRLLAVRYQIRLPIFTTHEK